MSEEGAFWRYLAGVVAAQAVCAAALVAGARTGDPLAIGLALLAALAAGCGVAWGFTALAASERRVREALVEARLAREREKIAVSLERRRASEARGDALAVTHAALDQSRGKAASLRWGLVGGGAAGVGLALIAAQFLTLGLAALALAGGAALGWRLRPGRTALVDVTPPASRSIVQRLRDAAPGLFAGAADGGAPGSASGSASGGGSRAAAHRKS